MNHLDRLCVLLDNNKLHVVYFLNYSYNYYQFTYTKSWVCHFLKQSTVNMINRWVVLFHMTAYSIEKKTIKTINSELVL